jgi:hypothetical protein
MVTPEPPSSGVDVNWSGLVDEARRHLRMDDLALAAARAEAFRLVAQLSGGGAAGSSPGARRVARA